MVRADLVVAKLAELDDRIQRAYAHRRRSAADLAADRDAMDLVAFNLMLAVQSCSDIAAHVVADEGWPAARSLAEGFQRLAEHGVITPATAAALSRAVGLRNVVAHGYAAVDVAAVHRAVTEGIDDLRRFAAEVAAWLSARATP